MTDEMQARLYRAVASVVFQCRNADDFPLDGVMGVGYRRAWEEVKDELREHGFAIYDGEEGDLLE